MRTSRVSSSTVHNRLQPKIAITPEDTFRNSIKQGQFTDQQTNKKQQKKKQPAKRQVNLKTAKTKLVVKGMQLSSESVQIHNAMLVRALRVHDMSYTRIRNHTYRTSI